MTTAGGGLAGLGNCGICAKPIQDPTTGVPSAVRHFKGHQLAHKACHDAWSADDQRLERARETVNRLNGQIAAMVGDRDRAQAVIDELSVPKE